MRREKDVKVSGKSYCRHSDLKEEIAALGI
jgi:hypothetical protein